MTVVIKGDRVVGVGSSGEREVPVDPMGIDATGKHLIPGLWDMHAHTASDRIRRTILHSLFFANGVTGIRNMTDRGRGAPRGDAGSG